MSTTKNGIFYPGDGTQKADVISDMQEMAESIDSIVEDDKENLRAIIDALPTENQEAEEISLKDTVALPFKEFTVKGNSKQEAIPTSENPISINNVVENIDITVSNFDNSEQQTIMFPLKQNQKLMSGDYLASDGIHHKRKQVELGRDEYWNPATWLEPHENTSIFYSNTIIDTVVDIVKFCNYFKCVKNAAENFNKDEEFLFNDINGSVNICVLKSVASTPEGFKNWLVSKKNEGNPIIVEYELSEEEIEAYDFNQQQAYNQLLNLRSYDNTTNVNSSNEPSPIFKVTAVKSIESVVNQINQVLLERS